MGDSLRSSYLYAKYCAKQNQDKLRLSADQYDKVKSDYEKGLKLIQP